MVEMVNRVAIIYCIHLTYINMVSIVLNGKLDDIHCTKLEPLVVLPAHAFLIF